MYTVHFFFFKSCLTWQTSNSWFTLHTSAPQPPELITATLVNACVTPSWHSLCISSSLSVQALLTSNILRWSMVWVGTVWRMEQNLIRAIKRHRHAHCKQGVTLNNKMLIFFCILVKCLVNAFVMPQNIAKLTHASKQAYNTTHYILSTSLHSNTQAYNTPNVM